jgi:flagellar hook-basal body complex protein FliE
MDLRLSSVTSPIANPYAAKLGSALLKSKAEQVAPAPEAGFSGALKGALNSVSAAQNKATDLQREVQMENPSVSLEETMVAIQKAQIGFQATLHVRNRMVQAYSDIMNMQV